MDLMDLQRFLEAAELAHLYTHLNEQGMDLKFLLLMTESDLRELVPRMVDKIKLRKAIEIHRQAETDLIPPSPVSNLDLVTSDMGESSSLVGTSFVKPGTATPPVPDTGSPKCDTYIELGTSTPLLVVGGGIQNSLTNWVEEEWQFVQEIGPIEDKKPLKELLEHTTFGKLLLNKQGHPLTTKERKTLVQLIVEHQLRILPSVKDTIRQEVWTSWATEICALFKGEHPDVYYVPYQVTERQALPASGLLHNRLITHRRFLKPGSARKRKSSSSSSSSSEKSQDSSSKRIRPLPPSFNTSVDNEDSDSSMKSIEWLQASSSPFEVLLLKWKDSFKAREKILKQKSIEDYFDQFPGLRLPSGHQLLASDFERAYPLASVAFNDNFPLIKKRLLELLVEKGTNIRAEPAVISLLDLATAGEEQGSVAALRCIPHLLKQVAPIPSNSRVKGKKWKPSRSEVSMAFIGYVSSPGDIERCIDDRATLTQDKGITFGPYIIAVGPSWSNITQYEVVVSKGVRYQFSDIKTALTTAFKIYFTLDIEYAADAAPCWMFVQRAVYKIKTKFDVLYDKSVTLRELIKDCERLS